MLPETKAQVHNDIIDMIHIMNSRKFPSNRKRTPIELLHGLRILNAIRKKYGIDLLSELSLKQLEFERELIYRITIRGASVHKYTCSKQIEEFEKIKKEE